MNARKADMSPLQWGNVILRSVSDEVSCLAIEILRPPLKRWRTQNNQALLRMTVPPPKTYRLQMPLYYIEELASL